MTRREVYQILIHFVLGVGGRRLSEVLGIIVVVVQKVATRRGMHQTKASNLGVACKRNKIYLMQNYNRNYIMVSRN